MKNHSRMANTIFYANINTIKELLNNVYINIEYGETRLQEIMHENILLWYNICKIFHDYTIQCVEKKLEERKELRNGENNGDKYKEMIIRSKLQPKIKIILHNQFKGMELK